MFTFLLQLLFSIFIYFRKHQSRWTDVFNEQFYRAILTTYAVFGSYQSVINCR